MTIENVGFPVREPMLQSGEVDAITGFSFSSFINLKDRGVPVDDIVVLLMADYGVNLYGNAIIVNPKFAAEKPEAVKGFLRAFVKGLQDTVKNPVDRGRLGAQAQRRRQEGRRARAPADGAQGQHPHARGEDERLRRRRQGPARQVDRPDRADLRVQERQAEGAPTCSTPRSCRPRPTARRTDGRAMRRGSCRVRVRRARWRQPRLRRRRPARLAVEGLSIAIERRRVRRRGRAVRLRQVHPDEARDRPAVSVQGHACRSRAQVVSKPVKIAGMAFQAPTLLPWRTTLENLLLPLEIVEPHRSRHPPPASAEYVARAENAARLGRPRAARATSFPGNCPAACSSAPRSAAR